ncbi:restriction endonuclease subunit S [Moheibacter sp.]|uniref:restriction endonuclease subunit S n=1 Tax=Moheibacter sp. TaxID=1965316 RepID=UPI003C77B497
MVKQGYKQTEIGVIPEDWEVVRIGDSFTFKNGLNKEKQYFGYGFPIVNYMDVFKNTFINSKTIKGRVFVNKQELKNFNVNKGDVLFTRTSETQEEIGYSAVIVDELIDTVFSGFILRGRPFNDLFSIQYCRYVFSNKVVRQQIISNASFTTRALTNGRVLSEVQIPLPPLPEQEAIAEALSDADAWIESLEQLIAKKRLIKQGAMQELLTPPSPSSGNADGEALEPWEVKKLGEVIEKCTTGKLDANAMVENGDYRFYTCAREFYYINEYAFDDEALLISGNGANVGYIHYYKGKFNAYQRTYVLLGFKINALFLKVILDKNLKDRIAKEVSAGNTPYIKMDTITDMVIKFPKSLSEQTRIAAILSDMDAELEALEQQLDKARQIKQGMMQELLTGRVRLCAPMNKQPQDVVP